MDFPGKVLFIYPKMGKKGPKGFFFLIFTKFCYYF